MARTTTQNILLGIGYVLAAIVTQSLPEISGIVSPFFLPIGVALAGFILFGFRVWPGIWLGALVVKLMYGLPWLVSIITATGSVIAPMLAAWLLQRVTDFRPAMTRFHDALWFLALGVIGCTTISATIGVTTFCTIDLIQWPDFPSAWISWWLGDSTGVLLTAPPILALLTYKHTSPIPWPRRFEALALTVVAMLISHLVFGGNLGFAGHNYPLTYLTYPMLVWAAMRFGLLGGSLAVLAVSLVSIWGTASGLGPFLHTHPTTTVGLIWTYTIFISVSTLLFVTLLAERKQAQRNLKFGADLDRLITNISSNFVNVTPHDTDHEINASLKKIGLFCDVDRSYVFTLQNDQNLIDNTHEWCSQWASPQIHNLQNINLPELAPWFTNKFRKGQTIHIPNVQDLPPTAELDKAVFQAQDILSLVTVPMTSAGKLVGFLGFNSVRVYKTWPQDVIVLLEIVAGIFVSALQRRQSEHALRSAHDLLEERVHLRTAELSQANRSLQEQILERQQAENQRTKLLTRTQQARTEADDARNDMLSLIERITDGFVALDRDWCYTYVNARAGKILGRDPKDLIGKHIWTEFPEGVGQPFYHNYLRAAQEQTPISIEEYYPPWDRWFDNKIFPSQDGLSIFFHDVTERKRADRALRLSDERFRLVTLATRDAIYDWDMKTDSVWFSDHFEQQYGPPGPSARRWWAKRIHPEDRRRVVAQFSHALRNNQQTWSSEYRLRLKNGHDAYVIDRGMITRDEQRRPTRVIGAITDITERKIAEQALRQSERLASVGTLAAGIAHEINNPLGSILLNTQFASTQIGDDHHKTALSECLQDIAMQAKRASQIVKGILQFSRQQDSQKRSAPIEQALHNARDLTRTYAQARGVPIDLRLPDPPPTVMMNPTEIEQVFVNLIKNAIDASDRTSPVHVHVQCDDHTAHIAIQDHGEGMTQDQISRAFDPFYSTRHDSGGTGLGLSITHGIVTQHMGEIHIHSTPGQGTTVTVTLPTDASSPTPPH